MGRSVLLAKKSGSLTHLILTTLPLLLVLVWFLYQAWRRPYEPIYNLGNYYTDDQWHVGNVPVVGAREHAFWLGSSVFDGARAFEGVTPS